MGAYQLKITIKGSKPPVWRRVLVPEGITFEELHHMIQTAFCWSSAHLYQFEFRSEGVRVVPGAERDNPKFKYIQCIEEIDGLVSETKKFTYSYNHKWELVIQMEKLPGEEIKAYGQVIKYKGEIIPEACDGIAGYYERADSFSVTELTYDIESVNARLQGKKAPKPAVFMEKEVSLKEIFDCYDKNSIEEIAKRHSMSGYSELKKDEFIQCVINHITDQRVMRNYFLCVRDAEMKLFEQIIEDNEHIAPYEAENMDYLYAGGYVTAGADNQFIISDQVKAAYKGINTEEFQTQRSRLSKIGDYLCAANSLYAVTPASIVIEMFNKYEVHKLSEGELKKAYETFLPYRSIVTEIGGKFVDKTLAEQNSYEELLQMQKQIPYYIPTELEIRFMSDHEGFLMTRELGELSSFLTGELGVEDKKIPYLLRQVQAEISLGGSLQAVIDGLGAEGILLQTSGQTEIFTSIITDVWNHTRMVLNRGYQPYEMVINGLEKDVPTQKTGQKIYPNDPCPCGSGRKYKKCCGKRS